MMQIKEEIPNKAPEAEVVNAILDLMLRTIGPLTKAHVRFLTKTKFASKIKKFTSKKDTEKRCQYLKLPIPLKIICHHLVCCNHQDQKRALCLLII